jgi:hypothetical protein
MNSVIADVVLSLRLFSFATVVGAGLYFGVHMISTRLPFQTHVIQTTTVTTR